jgi:hypothetical protein
MAWSGRFGDASNPYQWPGDSNGATGRARLAEVQKLVAEIMAAWRRAERLARTLPEGSPERRAAENACERLRDAYQELTHSGVAKALTEAEARLLLKDAASDVDSD